MVFVSPSPWTRAPTLLLPLLSPPSWVKSGQGAQMCRLHDSPTDAACTKCFGPHLSLAKPNAPTLSVMWMGRWMGMGLRDGSRQGDGWVGGGKG